MLAEQASSIELRLPEKIRSRARVFGSELAWAAADAALAVVWLALDGCAVVGVELWREQEGYPVWVATSNYSPGFDDAITSEEIGRCARKAGEFIQAYHQEPGALFNLMWLEPINSVVAEPAFS